MKIRILAILVCIIFAAVAVAGCGAKEMAFTLVNDTAWTFHDIHVAPSDAAEWGEDKLGASGVLTAGKSREITLEASEDGLYDIGAVDEENVVWGFSGLPIETGSTVTLQETETAILAVISTEDGENEYAGTLTWPDDDEETEEAAAEEPVQKEAPAEEEQPPAPGFTNVAPEMVEEQSRVNNHARIAHYGEWRYGTVYGYEGNYLVREKGADGSAGSVLVSGGTVTDVLFLDDATMFYAWADAGDATGLYRAAPDGSGQTHLAGGAIRYMQLYGGNLYFVNEATGYLLQCYNTATGEITTILEKAVFFPYVYGDKILYQDDADGETLHVCNMDGSEDVKITNATSFFPVYDGEYIYYVNGSDGYSIYRIFADGTGEQKLTAIPAHGIAVTGETVFFWGREDNKLYCMNKDGSDARVYAEQAVLNVAPTLLDGTVFFVQGDNEGLYYAAADGTIAPAMATPDPNPKPAPTPKPASNDRGDYFEEEGQGDYFEDEGQGDYFEEEGLGDVFD